MYQEKASCSDEQPCWGSGLITTECCPIRARRIRTAPNEESDVQTLLFSDAKELGEAIASLGIPVALGWLQVFPEDIAEDSVKTHGAGHLQAPPPVLLWDTLGVHLIADDLVRLIIEEEFTVSVGKIFPDMLVRRAGRRSQRRNQHRRLQPGVADERDGLFGKWRRICSFAAKDDYFCTT